MREDKKRKMINQMGIEQFLKREEKLKGRYMNPEEWKRYKDFIIIKYKKCEDTRINETRN